MKRFVAFLLLVIVVLFALVRCNPTRDTVLPDDGETIATAQIDQSTTNTTSDQIDGAVLIEEKCGSCHASSRVTGTAKTMDEWAATVDRMIAHGVELTTEDRQALIDFLSATYSK